METRPNGAVPATLDPEIVRVIDAFDEIVRPEGGSVSFLDVEDGKLRVAYRAGVNEDCPTCVMEPDALGLMMYDMLRDHAPQIDEVVVLVARSAGGAPA